MSSSLSQKLVHLRACSAPSDQVLTPADHLRLVHPASGRGDVVLASTGGGGWWSHRYAAADLADAARRRAGAVDQYVSHHAFRGGQETRHLAELRACHVDLDTYKVPGWQDHTPGTITTCVLAAIAEAALPPPSLVLFTGRGLHVTWLLHPVPARALPRWRAVQARLVVLLKDFGAAAAAATATGFTRLAGTMNSKSGRLVAATFVHPHLLTHGTRWTLDAMADHTLPVGRRQLAELRAARRAERQARDAARSAAAATTDRVDTAGRRRPVTRCTRRSYWMAVLGDLDRLLRLRGGLLPPGGRNNWLVCCAMALAWVVPAAELEAAIVGMGDVLADWTPKQTHSAVRNVLARAFQAEAGLQTGKNAEKGGATSDPRYRPGPAAIIARLDITPEEMRHADLRVLVDRDRARVLATERKRASRRRAGVVKRATYERTRAVRALAMARATLAAVATTGSVAAAARQAGIAVSTMRKRVSRAAALVAMRDTARHG